MSFWDIFRKKKETVEEDSSKNPYKDFLLGDDDKYWTLSDYEIAYPLAGAKVEINSFLENAFRNGSLDEGNYNAMDERIEAMVRLALENLNQQKLNRYLGIEKFVAFRLQSITKLEEKISRIQEDISQFEMSLEEKNIKINSEGKENNYEEK